MIERREREWEIERDKYKERYREGENDKRERDRWKGYIEREWKGEACRERVKGRGI